MAEVTLSEAQGGSRIVIAIGDTVVVRLTEQSGGGYRWTLTSVDAARLEMTSHRYEITRAGVGGAGVSVWRFTPKQAGRTRLELKHVRPWQADAPGAERFGVELEIREG